MNTSTPNTTARWLFLAGLIGVGFFAWLEVEHFYLAAQNSARLLSDAGLLTLALYLLIFLIGVVALVLTWFFPGLPRRFFGWFERLGRWRWLIVAAALLSITWFYLYSPWVGLWPGPWVQFIFAIGVATCIASFAQPQWPVWRNGRELVLGLAVFLYPRIVLELRASYRVALVYRSGTLLGVLLLFGLALWLFTGTGQAGAAKLTQWRAGLKSIRWLLAALLLLGPFLYLAAAGPKFYVGNPAIRFFWLLIEFYSLAFLIGGDSALPLSLKGAIMSAFALAVVSFVANALVLVVNYPFSLSWSEGNRFYDYSLFFGQSLYNHSGTIVNPYWQPGRYLLWSALFLWRGLPIAVHRLWNVVVMTIPALLVGWCSARKFRDPFLRAGLTLFIGLLFTVLSPVHPPFLVAAALALLFMYDPSLMRRGLALAVASIFMGTSRWTWIPVTAAWGVLGDLLLFYPFRPGSLVKRLWPTFVLAALGLLPGLIAGYSGLPLSSSSFAYHQPLLWYRLLPNPTFPLGVLFATILVSGPAVSLLLWWVLSGRWRLDWLQKLAIAGALAGFLGAGLVVSMKIGGGADLHNLDMYLMTLVLVVTLGLYSMSQSGEIHFLAWPVWTQALLGFMILYPLYTFTPFFAGAAQSPLLSLPKPQEANQALSEIQKQADLAGQRGDVLFMDQRQLLTFGYIHNVRFVPDYEKKYMMDQAMASSSDYFQQYYRDLSNKRFQLIVTEILTTRQETGADFSEENNAWVRWVSEPTLCFYEPVMINKDMNVELLVPKDHPLGCDVYLHSGG
ncbi:MAG TPA: hypothetical protein VF784_11760 [Anaerolineales bacterium]